MFRKKNELSKEQRAMVEAVIDQVRKEEQVEKKDGHIVTKTDFPVKCPVITHNFGDLLRYFLYGMSSGMITATVERMVQRELANRKDFPYKFVFGAIGIGIMIFLMCMGYMILTTGGGSTVQSAAGAIGSATGSAGGALGGVVHG